MKELFYIYLIVSFSLFSCEHSSEKENHEKTTLDLFIFLLGTVTGGLVVHLYSRNRIKKIFKHNPEFLNSIQYPKFTCNYIRIIKALYNENENNKKQIADLNRESPPLIQETSSSNNSSYSPIEINKSNINTEEESKDVMESSNEEIEISANETCKTNKPFTDLFFSIPYSEGYFSDMHKSLEREPTSFYKIILTADNKGELHFLTGNFDKTALDDINGYLSPVCHIENIDNRLYANEIIMIEHGEVVLENGHWKVYENKKVKIKLV